MKNALRNLLVLMTTTCVVLLLAAWAFTWYVAHNPYKFLIGEALCKFTIMQNGLLTLHDSHPTRGWTPKPRVKMGQPKITTNDRGQRAIADYTYQPDKYTIMVVGDSFTFGEGVDDDAVWPALLQQQEPRFHVVNLGVSGYGIDQIFITERETIEEYKPQLLIFAFIGEDLERTSLAYRDYKKPKFELSEKGELVLTNTPIGSPPEVVAELKRRYPWPCRTFELLLESRREAKILPTPAFRERLWALDTKIFEEAQQCAADHHVEFLLAYLADSAFINNPALTDAGEKFLNEYTKDHDVTLLNTRPIFLEKKRQWNLGHYGGPESRVVADAVLAKIRELPSWRKYGMNNQK